MIKVSIIVTVFNIKVILVDDGSADRSSAICDEFSNIVPRLIVIHQHNNGAPVARSSGIDVSSGVYWFC